MAGKSPKPRKRSKSPKPKKRSPPPKFSPVKRRPNETRKERYERIDRSVCNKWYGNPYRNPLTNRVITREGRVYAKLYKTCKNIFQNDVVVDGLTLVRGHAIGDGNCFFHSLGQLIEPDYDREKGIELRERIADSFDEQEYQDMNGFVEEPYDEFKEMFSDPREWANESMIAYTAKALNINILIYHSERKRLIGAGPIIPNRPVVFIFNWDQGHFDPMFGENGQKIFEWNQVQDNIKDLI